MAWTNPGKKPEGQNSPEQDSPPDLDKMVKDQWRKLRGLIGKKFGSYKFNPANIASAIGILAVILWGLSGIFIVKPGEQAVMFKLGRYQATLDPGLHWLPRFIASTMPVDLTKKQTYVYQEVLPTHDQSLVDVSLSVSYRVVDAENYLFKVANPDKTVQQASLSALRQVIGSSDVEVLLTSQRHVISAMIAQQINKNLLPYHLGISLTEVLLQSITLPAAVQAAFNDVIKSTQDEQHTLDQAKIYADKAMSTVQNQVQRILADAELYRQQMVLTAQTETAEYAAILPAYHQAPAVMRQHLYLTAMEAVLAKTNKILVDGDQNRLYLSLPQGLDAHSLTVNTHDPVLPKPVMQVATANNTANNPTNTVTPGKDITAERLPRFAVFNPDSQVGQRGATS